MNSDSDRLDDSRLNVVVPVEKAVRVRVRLDCIPLERTDPSRELWENTRLLLLQLTLGKAVLTQQFGINAHYVLFVGLMTGVPLLDTLGTWETVTFV